ncbi:dihydrofolate reductase family protein [Mucilaginibacter ginkgonis]|uniref:Dihydrofolate reductase family protein n=1 Tax=Mucilaginibacter ginkgonis TaxID=2682091 RepID=A0A7T7F9G7_9SPHI|nr:dihydrofolate reductase family protein [Mucilaginibacter ginkgonis]QQL48965.1 dihydrofolate reductase family protein [Mucilaginibacter ginkgonis]
MFTLTIHMVSSLDGYIAKHDNSISWFETADNYENGTDVTADEAVNFLKTIDCYVMGAATYEHALNLSKDYGWVYGDTPTVVVTNRDLPIERPNIEIYRGDLAGLVEKKLKPAYNNVWLVGGAKLAKDFLRLGLADEIRQSILPIILGDGLPFYDVVAKEIPMHLKNVRAHKSGMVELHYQVKK